MERVHLTDPQIADILREVDPKERETKRTCPLCDQGMIAPRTAQAYLDMVSLFRHRNDRAIDLLSVPEENDGDD